MRTGTLTGTCVAGEVSAESPAGDTVAPRLSELGPPAPFVERTQALADGTVRR